MLSISLLNEVKSPQMAAFNYYNRPKS